MSDSVNRLVEFVQDHYQTKEFIPLHAPVFIGREREYVLDTVDSTFVSSVGAYVDRFEQDMASYTGAERGVATVNGTAALHVALRMANVGAGDLVITQPLSFVATCNAISYCGAEPVFVDVDRYTMGLSAASVESWLEECCTLGEDGIARTKNDARAVRACVPMHTFGHPVDLDPLVDVCRRWNLVLIEDAAESLGSFYKGRHTGTFGTYGTLSFNGNKIITTGGGGMVLTSEALGKRVKHLTTTAKQPHAYEYIHDEVGYNYRMPNLNAALGCAQLEQLEGFISEKRELARCYSEVFKNTDLAFFEEPEFCCSNYWLNALVCESRDQRDHILEHTNSLGVMTRPIWALMNHLSMYAHCIRGPLPNAEWLAERVINLPSGVVGDVAP